MGSFYVNCSITNKTIVGRQQMYIQFMVPSNNSQYESNNDKKHGTSPKGVIVSNEGGLKNWVPFGPAILGYYNDCGNIIPSNDDETTYRIKVLETLMGGLSFKTIMYVAQDDRWYRYGLGYDDDKKNKIDKYWLPNDMPPNINGWQLELCKKISLTYFHASVYDEMKNANVGSETKNYIDRDYKNFCSLVNMKSVDETFKDVSEDDLMDTIKSFMKVRELSENVRIFTYLDSEIRTAYRNQLQKIEEKNFGWFRETLNFTFSLCEMNMILQQSTYGSQERNWTYHEKIEKTLNPILQANLKEYEEDDYYGDFGH